LRGRYKPLRMFFSKSKSILGVDVGTSNIKIAQVTHDSQRVLDTYGMVTVAADMNSRNNDGTIKRVAEVLKELMQQARVSTKRCVASLPNASVFTSIIDMPKMTSKELDSAMEYEGKKYIPLPISEMNLSWSVVSQNAQTNTIKVLLTAVPKLVIENYIRLFDLAGLQPEVMDIEALALLRSLVFEGEKNNAIIDIGAKSTSLIIIKNGLLQLSRNIGVGGDAITSRIAQTLGISDIRAEQFKRDFGVSDSTFLPDAIKPVLAGIKNEIKQLLSIYQGQGSPINKVVIVGGGAQLPGLVGFLSDMGVAVEIGNPLRLVAYPKASETVLKRFSLHLPVAIGLALRYE
jgi:type IV pilus assembly protein PilM